MESTISVSKGVFVFKNKVKSFKEESKKRGRKKEKNNVNINANEHWYQTYLELWKVVEKKIQVLHMEMSSSISNELIFFITSSHDKGNVSEIPTAALLTGVNMPDHAAQFTALIRKMKENPMLHVACLYSEDGHSIKSLVETMINQFVCGTGYSSDEEDEFEEERKVKIKKVNYNFAGLRHWYESEGKNSLFVVIIPDFESFNVNVLHSFISIVSSYINILPFTFVFGIATSLTILHRMLPQHISSKINIQFFNSQPSMDYLNTVLERVFLSDMCPFQLGGNIFRLFMDVFLFYDLSVTGFIQKWKYALLEHFSYGNVMTLCTKSKKRGRIIQDFTNEDCENARRLLSFRKLVEGESPANQIKLLSDDDCFKERLKYEIENNLKYLNHFHLFLRCLQVLTADLPEQPLGKQLRELYCIATSMNITKTNEYSKCFQLLQLQSKIALTEKIRKIGEIIENNLLSSTSSNQKLESHLQHIYDILASESVEDDEVLNNEEDETVIEQLRNMQLVETTGRAAFRNNLLGNINSKKPVNKFETTKKKLLAYIAKLFEIYLYQPTENYFYEIFFSYDSSIENQIIGIHRAALHAALNDPHTYLQCDCCDLPNDASILKTMPDICIVYKLHLEYGKMIILYDWLQAFASIVDPFEADDEEDKKEIDPQLHARFTQAVAELEFLGFIKSSKRKTDHVQRLTWGG